MISDDGSGSGSDCGGGGGGGSESRGPGIGGGSVGSASVGPTFAPDHTARLLLDLYPLTSQNPSSIS